MGGGRGSRAVLVAMLLLVLLLSAGPIARSGGAAPVPVQAGQVARIVRDLAPVYAAPDVAQANRRDNVCGSQWLNTLMGDSLDRNRPCNYCNSEST